MPLLVHCPNNCQIRLPSNRMGKVVRCVDCQTPIRIPELDTPLLRTGNWVECRAKRAIKKTEFSNGTDPSDLPESKATEQPSVHPLPVDYQRSSFSESEAELPLELPPQTLPQRSARLLRAKPWRIVQPLTRVDLEDRMPSLELEAEPSPSVHSPQKPTEGQTQLSTVDDVSGQECSDDAK